MTSNSHAYLLQAEFELESLLNFEAALDQKMYAIQVKRWGTPLREITTTMCCCSEAEAGHLCRH